jgi:hypothetical protein
VSVILSWKMDRDAFDGISPIVRRDGEQRTSSLASVQGATSVLCYQ